MPPWAISPRSSSRVERSSGTGISTEPGGQPVPRPAGSPDRPKDTPPPARVPSVPTLGACGVSYFAYMRDRFLAALAAYKRKRVGFEPSCSLTRTPAFPVPHHSGEAEVGIGRLSGRTKRDSMHASNCSPGPIRLPW